MRTVQAGARLDRLPRAFFHNRLLALVSLGMFLDSFDNSIGATILGELLNSHWSTLELNAHFISATFIGISIGVFFSGLMGDKFGRRFSYQFNLLIFGAASFAAALAPSMPWLIAFRFIMGIGLGAEFVVGYSLITEFMPPGFRGRATSVVAFFSMAASLVAAFCAYLLIPTIGWRWLFAMAGFGSIIAWYLRKDIPESPRWLEASGKLDEADRVLSGIEAEVSKSHPLPPIVPGPPPSSTTTPIWVLFSRPVVRRTLLAMLANVVIGFATYGFILWLPTFFIKGGFSIKDSLMMNTIIQLGAPIGPLFGIFMSDKIGRKVGIAWGGFAAAALMLLFPFQTHVVGIVINGFLLTAFVLGLLGFAVGTYTPELFPTEYRMRGNGIAQLAGRLMSIGSPYLVVSLLAANGLMAVASTGAAALAVMALATAIFGIETKRKSLESIGTEEQQEFSDVPAVTWEVKTMTKK